MIPSRKALLQKTEHPIGIDFVKRVKEMMRY
jgi:hypothetical protein